MSFKIVVLLAIVAVSAAKDIRTNAQSKNSERWYEKGVRFSYDCSGKADGNYPHPTKCTHYVACVAETEAYEMVCADNLDGTPLHYVQNSGPDPATSRCDYPAVAGCAGPEPTQAPPAPTEAPAPEPTDAPAPEPTAAPEPEPEPEVPECDPETCKLEGDCQSYRQCIDGKWVDRNCNGDNVQGDLFWNPEANPIHGGVCDYFNNLSEGVRGKYEADENCVPPCAWIQNESCSPNYVYRSPFNQTTADRETSLSCPQGPAGSEALLWNQATKTCDKCSDVTDANGSACAC